MRATYACGAYTRIDRVGCVTISPRRVSSSSVHLRPYTLRTNYSDASSSLEAEALYSLVKHEESGAWIKINAVFEFDDGCYSVFPSRTHDYHKDSRYAFITIDKSLDRYAPLRGMCKTLPTDVGWLSERLHRRPRDMKFLYEKCRRRRWHHTRKGGENGVQGRESGLTCMVFIVILYFLIVF